MSALQKAQPQENALVTAEHAAAVRTALKNSLYPGASDASVDLVLAYCKAGGYDPMTKPVHIVPMKVSTGRKNERGYDIKETRDIVMPGIGLYRINASRTGQYAGVSEPEFGPTKTLSFTREKWEEGPNGKNTKRTIPAEIQYPEWCRITIQKFVDGQLREFTAKEFWLENYAQKGDDEAPNAMWEKRPFGQLAKCAEAQALRKAFPESVGSQPTAEEMEGKIIEGEATLVPQGTGGSVVRMPQARQETTNQPAADAEHAIEGEALPDTRTQGEIGIFLNESQKKLLLAKGRQVNLDEEALIQKFDRIDGSNINTVLAKLRTMADEQG